MGRGSSAGSPVDTYEAASGKYPYRVIVVIEYMQAAKCHASSRPPALQTAFDGRPGPRCAEPRGYKLVTAKALRCKMTACASVHCFSRLQPIRHPHLAVAAMSDMLRHTSRKVRPLLQLSMASRSAEPPSLNPGMERRAHTLHTLPSMGLEALSASYLESALDTAGGVSMDGAVAGKHQPPVSSGSSVPKLQTAAWQAMQAGPSCHGAAGRAALSQRRVTCPSLLPASWQASDAEDGQWDGSQWASAPSGACRASMGGDQHAPAVDPIPTFEGASHGVAPSSSLFASPPQDDASRWHEVTITRINGSVGDK